MQSYVVTANRNRQVERMLAFKGGAEPVSVDFSPWEDDNGTVTAVDWSVESGQADVSGEALTASVATAVVTTSESGVSLIKLTATAGSNIGVFLIEVRAKDPQIQSVDYGMCNG